MTATGDMTDDENAIVARWAQERGLAKRLRDPAVRARVRLMFGGAVARRPGSPVGDGPPRRHRAEVTADRLTDDVIHFCDRLTGEERDAAGLIIQALREIADGERQ